MAIIRSGSFNQFITTIEDDVVCARKALIGSSHALRLASECESSCTSGRYVRRSINGKSEVPFPSLVLESQQSDASAISGGPRKERMTNFSSQLTTQRSVWAVSYVS